MYQIEVSYLIADLASRMISSQKSVCYPLQWFTAREDAKKSNVSQLVSIYLALGDC